MASLETIALLAAALVGGLYVAACLIYYKLSWAICRLERQTTNQANNVISQIEALLSLYAEIRPTHGLPPTRGWAASPDFLRLLTRFVSETQPMTVVECSSGLSTLVLAACMRSQGQGHVYSLEHEPEFAAKTRDLIRLHDLGEWATIVDAPLQELSLPNWEGPWYDTTGLPSDIAIDMLVIDGPPQSTAPLARYPALPVLGKRMRPGGIVLLDDADRADERLITAAWKKECPSLSDIPFVSAEKGVACLKQQIQSLACAMSPDVEPRYLQV